MAPGSTAASDIGRNNLFDAREVLGQDTAPFGWLCRACRLGRINRFILGMHDGYGRLNVFQREVILVRMPLLGLRAVKGALEVGEQLLKANDATFLALDDPVLL